LEMKLVFRSDTDEAHRLSLSGRVLPAMENQVKAKHGARPPQQKHFSQIGRSGADRPLSTHVNHKKTTSCDQSTEMGLCQVL
jgi:hypothetical protein